MEEQKKSQSGAMNENGMCGGCGMCQGNMGWNGYGHGMYPHTHGLLRLVLGVAILVFVFWAGVKLGELKGMFESNTGRGYDGLMMGSSRYGRSMMQSGYLQSAPYPAQGQSVIQSVPASK